MSTGQTTGRSPLRFYLGFAVVALLIAGLLSYFADSDPDGLDSVTMNGCTEVAGELRGDCIAQNARDHDLAGGPLADYAVQGDEGLTGIAGVAGVLITLVIAGGLFWVVRRRRSTRDDPD